jgi:hypothetical protein
MNQVRQFVELSEAVLIIYIYIYMYIYIYILFNYYISDARGSIHRGINVKYGINMKQQSKTLKTFNYSEYRKTLISL